MSDKVEEKKNNEEQNNPEQPQTSQNLEDKPQENTPNQDSSPQNPQEEKPQENGESPQENNEPQKIENENNEEKANVEGENGEKKEEGEKKEDEDDEGEEKEEDDEETQKKKAQQEKEEKEKKKQQKAFNDKMKDLSIEQQISDETIQIEQKKIDLRIMKERLAQKEKLYNELQGKPTNKTSEEKEKERRDKKKANKNHKFTDPIVRKKGREKQIQDDREKIAKEDIRKRAQFQKLTTDINELIISNKELKEQIIDLRKRKLEALKKRDEIIQENEEKKENLKEMLKQNEISKSQIMHKEYKETVNEGIEQQKEFEAERDELENEYQKLREEYIRRERENKKENAKKRNMAALALSNKGMSTRDKDMEMELKKLADEEIMDRIPMLDQCIEKWNVINTIKKTSIQVFQQNSSKIRDAFNKLTKYLGLDSFTELPLVYKKTEQQMSNINMYKEKLETQNDKLEYEKELINKQIELLSGKKKNINLKKSDFIQQKLKSIEVIDNCSDNFKKEIDKRMKLIEAIKLETHIFLTKFHETFLSDFIVRKVNIDESSEYNEKTVNKYLSNVQDYSKLIQEWKSFSKDNKVMENDLAKLRDDILQKLGKFEKARLLNKDLAQSMESDYKKGIKLEEIIRKSSQKIALDIQNPYSKSTVLTKTIKKKNGKNQNISIATTEPGNNRYGNDSSITRNQQSSIIEPNTSTTTRKNNKSVKIAEAA
jgi:hypothetical protein